VNLKPREIDEQPYLRAIAQAAAKVSSLPESTAAGREAQEQYREAMENYHSFVETKRHNLKYYYTR